MNHKNMIFYCITFLYLWGASAAEGMLKKYGNKIPFVLPLRSQVKDKSFPVKQMKTVNMNLPL